MQTTRRRKRHDVTFLKKGEKVRVYNLATGRQLPGEYVVVDTRFQSAHRSKGKGKSDSWHADLRKLRGNEYHPRARMLKVQYSALDASHKYAFERICTMKQVWVSA